MVPALDVDVLPLNVHWTVAPLSVKLHVSVTEGPLTPKFAIAGLAGVTESVVDIDTPPKVAVTVAVVALCTVCVKIANVAVVSVAGTMTEAFTVTGPLDVNATRVPPEGAGPLMVTVPVTEFPLAAVVGAAVTEATVSAGAAVTVIVCDD